MPSAWQNRLCLGLWAFAPLANWACEYKVSPTILLRVGPASFEGLQRKHEFHFQFCTFSSFAAFPRGDLLPFGDLEPFPDDFEALRLDALGIDRIRPGIKGK